MEAADYHGQLDQGIDVQVKTEQTIHDILREMEAVLSKTQSKGDKRGYFLAIYQAETVHVRNGISQGRFLRPDLIEALAVNFARRYLDAFYSYDEHMPVTRAWFGAFKAAHRSQPSVLQHILMGINAHINLDLGLSVAKTVPNGQLELIEADFEKINILIAEMTDVIQERISLVSPWMKWVDRLGGRVDEYLFRKLVEFSRDRAWDVAKELQTTDRQTYEFLVDDLDDQVYQLGRTILRPAPVTRTLMSVTRLSERGSVGNVIDSLVTHMEM